MRSTRERLAHTILFEVGAIAIVSPVIARVTGAPIVQAGAATLVLSGMASGCNDVWTMVFDRWVPTRRRNLRIRVAQALGLEALISLFAIPTFYFLAGATLREAILLDLSGLAFFIVYAMAYNAVFEKVMLRTERSPERAQAALPGAKRP